MATTITTHVCLVLDRSGSMQAVHDDALGGVNGYITAAKQDRALYKSRFSLITFNSKSVDTKRGQRAADKSASRPIASHQFSKRIGSRSNSGDKAYEPSSGSPD